MSGENDRIKSAFEIAMAKVEKYGSLSDEERRRLKDEELTAAGTALFQRYMNGLPLRDIEIELAKYKEGDRHNIKGHLLSRLLKDVDIDSITQESRLLPAIKHLSGGTEITQRVNDLHQKYISTLEKARKENLGKLESAKRIELELIGISGSAVQPAFETSPEWLQIQQGLRSSYQEKLEEIKNEVFSHTLPHNNH